MLAPRDVLKLSVDSLRAHKLRGALTILGLTMGVATLITVMTLIQGANAYVEQKIARLGTDVFQISRMPFTVMDFDLILKAMRFKKIDVDDLRAVAERCVQCDAVGGEIRQNVRSRARERELLDTGLIGQTANMVDIDNRTLAQGRFFTDAEDHRSAQVCIIGSKLRTEFFAGLDPIGRTVRLADQEFTVVGVFDEIGSVLGQEQDNFAVIPINTWLKLRGSRNSIVINVKAEEKRFEPAQDEARLILRARRHVPVLAEDDFFIGTKESYMALWRGISSAFFLVFVVVSAISAVVGGVVIMNVMLVSVTERTKEIGVRRAVGATQADIRRQFLTESIMQCVIGGAMGIAAGFAVALLLQTFTAFPASIRAWVVLFGIVVSSGLGLFFGIYPATRAARLDPVVALRSE